MKKHRILYAFLVAALTLGVVPATAFAEGNNSALQTAAIGDSITVEGINYTILSEPADGAATVKVGDNRSYSGAIVRIPATVSSGGVSYVVEAIGNQAFQNTDLTSVTIPDSVKTIGDSAFRECENLTTVNGGENVTKVDNNAFYRCTNLTSIGAIGGKLETIRMQSFAYTAITSFTLTKNLTNVGIDPFRGCDKLTNVTIEDDVTGIPDNMFSDCIGLAEIVIPDSVTVIGKSAFSSCVKIKEITIPSGVVSFGNYALLGTGLTEFPTLPDGVKTISFQMFAQCDSLTEVTIPAHIEVIEAQAFSLCDNLETFTVLVDDAVPQVPSDIFEGNPKITLEDIIYQLDSSAISASLNANGTASWSAVSAAESYDIQLYKGGAAVGDPVNVPTPTNSYDFSDIVNQNGSGDYSFTVNVNGVNGIKFTLTDPIEGAASIHFHVFGSEWKSDENGHWHECSCGAKDDEAAHIETVINKKDATETEKGYTGDTVCSVCDDVIAQGKEIPVIKKEAPVTGDDTDVMLWMSICGGAFVLVAATVVLRFAEKKR